MQAPNKPVQLWCFCYEYPAELISLLANSRFDLQGRTPYESVMHYTPDILEYVSFEWCPWCWYFDKELSSKQLCHWIVTSHQVGKLFCYYLILDNVEYISQSSVIPIPESNFPISRWRRGCRHLCSLLNIGLVITDNLSYTNGLHS